MTTEEKIESLQKQLDLSNENYTKLNKNYITLRKYNTKKCQEVSELRKKLNETNKVSDEEEIDTEIMLKSNLVDTGNFIDICFEIIQFSYLFNDINVFRDFLFKYHDLIVDVHNLGVDKLEEIEKE